MNMKKIILISVISLVSFSASFAAFWFTRKASESSQPAVSAADGQIADSTGGIDLTPEPITPQASPAAPSESSLVRKLTEEQLRTYIFDIREQMNEQQNRMTFIKTREQQLTITQNVISEDVKELDNLRVTLAALVAEIRDEQQRLESNLLEISEIEKTNFVSLAAMYDKMDSTSASKIMASMCKSGSQSVQNGTGFDDAVKILKYMTDRTKAKLLAEMANTEPSLASEICKRLKYTVEKG